MNYDEALKQIEFFELHPSYLPFVGSDYEEYRILQISESHYCTNIKDHEKYGIKYFDENWFQGKCSELDEILDSMTRGVCKSVINNCRYANFDNPLRAFCETVLKMDNPKMSKYNENRKKYNYFAFMNFYQLPAFKDKASFENSFWKLSKHEKIEAPEAKNILERWRKESSKIIDAVIDILEPKMIAMVSIDAWESYVKYGKYKYDKRLVKAAHPCIPWYIEWEKLGNMTGKAAFVKGLERIYKEERN